MKSKYINHLGRKHQIVRLLWTLTWAICARWLPRSVFSGWKRFLLRLFGAKIAPTAIVYSSAKIYYPANLMMDEYACLASDVDCYNVAPVYIGKICYGKSRSFFMYCFTRYYLSSSRIDNGTDYNI